MAPLALPNKSNKRQMDYTLAMHHRKEEDSWEWNCYHPRYGGVTVCPQMANAARDCTLSTPQPSINVASEAVSGRIEVDIVLYHGKGGIRQLSVVGRKWRKGARSAQKKCRMLRNQA